MKILSYFGERGKISPISTAFSGISKFCNILLQFREIPTNFHQTSTARARRAPFRLWRIVSVASRRRIPFGSQSPATRPLGRLVVGQNQTPKMQSSKSRFQNPKYELQNAKFKMQNPKSKMQNPKSKIYNSGDSRDSRDSRDFRDSRDSRWSSWQKRKRGIFPK